MGGSGRSGNRQRHERPPVNLLAVVNWRVDTADRKVERLTVGSRCGEFECRLGRVSERDGSTSAVWMRRAVGAGGARKRGCALCVTCVNDVALLNCIYSGGAVRDIEGTTTGRRSLAAVAWSGGGGVGSVWRGVWKVEVRIVVRHSTSLTHSLLLSPLASVSVSVFPYSLTDSALRDRYNVTSASIVVCCSWPGRLLDAVCVVGGDTGVIAMALFNRSVASTPAHHPPLPQFATIGTVGIVTVPAAAATCVLFSVSASSHLSRYSRPRRFVVPRLLSLSS